MTPCQQYQKYRSLSCTACTVAACDVVFPDGMMLYLQGVTPKLPPANPSRGAAAADAAPGDQGSDDDISDDDEAEVRQQQAEACWQLADCCSGRVTAAVSVTMVTAVAGRLTSSTIRRLIRLGSSLTALLPCLQLLAGLLESAGQPSLQA